MNTLSQGEQMKFILNGRTFDTSSSKVLAISSGVYTPGQFEDSWPAQSVRFESVLYRTPKGSLFVHEHETAKYMKGKPVVKDTVEEMTSEQAVKWIADFGAKVLDSTGLDLPEEA